jgi:hypothetical protein
MLADGKVNVAPLITGTVGLPGVEAAFDALGDPEAHAKILIDPKSARRAPFRPTPFRDAQIETTHTRRGVSCAWCQCRAAPAGRQPPQAAGSISSPTCTLSMPPRTIECA